MKGDVKRHFSPTDWEMRSSRAIQPLRVWSAVVLSRSAVPWVFIRTSTTSSSGAEAAQARQGCHGNHVRLRSFGLRTASILALMKQLGTPREVPSLSAAPKAGCLEPPLLQSVGEKCLLAS